MEKKILQIIAVLAVALFMAGPLCAKPWGIVATFPDYYADNESDNDSIHTIDLGQTPPMVYGPFLQGQLAAYRGADVLDIALIKKGKQALISTFGNARVHLVDLKDPTNPVLLGSLDLPFAAEDIAITRDSKTALVTDGAFSPFVAIIDLKTFTLTNVIDLGSMSAQAVDISRKNIVILADYWGGMVHYGKLNKMRTGFESLRSIALCAGAPDNQTDCEGPLGWPINVTISPNGRTALIANAWGGVLFVFEITKKGDLIPGTPFILTGLPGGPLEDYDGGNQSIAFQNNKTAYVTAQRWDLPGNADAIRTPGGFTFPDADGVRPDQLCLINVLKPGQTQYVTARFTLLNSCPGQFYGVDTLAIMGKHALVGNASTGIPGPFDNPYYNHVVYIDLRTGLLIPVELNNYGVASGVAIKK